ncbi:MAG: LON peptidase substrate-binding domain-containing protein [Gammaproteobacteria bacterium]|nr:LON peptidase substrate-binding domain-containing protein [Gammaproteobacteria bacterium]MBU2678281.1 LON peptidase substrate-binding domain-containing protein [Gammaproteobacteria bacterium]NNL52016.1 peptidase S16 [Woeseiaceae bacterium]
MEIPLFPLRTVLFPGGPLPLRIFESRYIDMISRCMKDESPFGVVLIREGQEDGPATTYEVGTLATITDWYQGSDGLLGVTAAGAQRFRLLSGRQQADGLNIGKVEVIEPEPAITLPAEYASLEKILEGVLDDLGRLYESLDRSFDDAVWVSYRLVEILPIQLEQKQEFLESNDTLARLERISQLLNTVRGPITGY